ncbi:DUF523 domain-containing protein [Motiliproteus coralliicola]|uniref:DUF523 domain-containing protein n=1 Tax=Motiliproteus coralliicola TaxID=2283196 RepID=A0A369WTE0_9GAMM|nr:DUF523 domain-containing protein [Motiliproteus coralliicola]RDE22765.1 DUF523 domain-containing protein [Motiliproteus coralliicola]
MDRILVSRCLLGEPVRYDASPKSLDHPLLDRWRDEQRLVPICPEMAGGLPCPRPPAEVDQGRGDRVIKGDARVLCHDGSDVTDAFVAGAKIALAQCRQQQIRFALLKARSPSCGNQDGYDGSFSGTLAEQGVGVTAALLISQGIRVFDETQLEQLAEALDRD